MGNQRGFPVQPDVGDVLREHVQRIRRLEALRTQPGAAAWQDWTPTLYGNLGDDPTFSTAVGRYLQIPDGRAPLDGSDFYGTVFGWGYLAFATAGSGDWYFGNLPVDAALGGVHIGSGYLFDATGGNTVVGLRMIADAPNESAWIAPGADPGPAGLDNPGWIRPTWPVIVDAATTLQFSFAYEAHPGEYL